jgi:hypothetical protein
MSDKNGSPSRLSAAAEGSESEEPELATSRARESDRGEATFLQSKKPPQKGRLEHPLPSHRYSTSHGMLDRSLQAQLGRQLRAIYSDVAEEPVPDRFIRLLEELEAREMRKEKRQ